MAMQITIQDESFAVMNTLALTYAVHHWDKFAEEMGLNNGPDGESGMNGMRDEICHHTAEMLYHNHSIIALLIRMWGEEKVTEFVDKLLLHEH